MSLTQDVRVRLEPEVAEALRERAKAERRSLANLTRCALEDYLSSPECLVGPFGPWCVRQRPAGAGEAEKLLADMLRAGCSDCSTAPASVVLRVWVGASAQGELEAFCAECARKHVSEGMAPHLEEDVVDAQCPGVFGEARA